MRAEIRGVAPDMQDSVADFLAESDELIAGLDTLLVTLESAPNDLDLLNNIFRAAHTIKGASSFVGLDQITGLTHRMEDVLNRLRKGELKVTRGMMDVLLEALDHLKELMNDVRENAIVERDLNAIITKLATYDPSETDASAPAPQSPVSAPIEKTIKATSAASASETAVATNAPSPAKEPTREPARAVTKEVVRKIAKESSTEATPKDAKKGDQTVRVQVERLDSLMNLVGQLVLGRNTLLQTTNEMCNAGIPQSAQERIGGVSAQINFITTELQGAVMKLRMLPIGKVFSRFPRLVRDIASQTGKQIELEMYGEDTELDKTVIEEVGDPLIHLVRNSCDHGIETPEVRRAVGKDESGRVVLRAAQQGSNILITIEDDGKGLDLEAIKAKALERGLATEADLARMSTPDIFRFIFAPGFSTAKVVSGLSGRGVGMDVVRTNIEKLKGMIELESAAGRGSKVTIKLPLTLAIIQGLLVRVAGDIFIVPLASVNETVKVGKGDMATVNGAKVIRLRDRVLPIFSLPRLLRGEPGTTTKSDGESYVVVIGFAEKRLGLMVDDLLGQKEVVIKSLGATFGNLEGLAGATILGDGRIRLIVDVAGLFALSERLRVR